jgi:hypothetical protein
VYTQLDGLAVWGLRGRSAMGAEQLRPNQRKALVVFVADLAEFDVFATEGDEKFIAGF